MGTKMLSNRKMSALGKFSAYILRHGAHKEGISVDSHGWISIEQLMEKASSQGHSCDLDDIQDMVRLDNKGRYQISPDGLFIRALQGHSSEVVNIDFKVTEPPRYLFHGTATRFLESIKETGINKAQRQYVHLSDNLQTAAAVGKRHGNLVILRVDSQQMYQNGCVFYLSENNVWLTDFVDPDYIVVIG